MKGLLRFIFSRSFIKNFAFSGIVFFLVVGLAFFLLNGYTNHGESIDVPDLKGLGAEDARDKVEAAGLRCKIEEPVFMPKMKLGELVSQNPSPTYVDPEDGETKSRKVKENRTIYLTFNHDKPPLVEMPDLVEIHSRRSAEMTLKMIGLEVGEVKTERSKYPNLVLKQLYKGKQLEAGTKIPRGEKITLVIGAQNTSQVSVPKLIGYTYKEAENILSGLSLNIGTITSGCESCASPQDTLNSYILNQSPELGEYLSRGASINVILTQDQSKIQ